MRKLSRIILINAAGFDYLEFPVGGHSQVIGVNGHGKSTVLRTVLFFYLGSNDKAPYALHETKSDFVSYYLGEPPSYLIYEVERGEGMPAYHVVVTRPASRIQFHFVDAPYSRDYYVEGSFVQPVQTALERIREAGQPVESVGSYDQFVQRIYGIVPSPFAVFRPVAKSSGQIGVLARIISGIFTVSQLDADKLKSALTCGMRSDVASGELDLALLKGQLENFRRVNRAVKTYLNHEQEALDMVDLAESFEMTRSERGEAIRELIRAAKCLPERSAAIEQERTERLTGKQAQEERYESEGAVIRGYLEQLTKEIAILADKIHHAEKVEALYLQLDIEGKAARLQRELPGLLEEKMLADEKYQTLTARYQDENEHRKSTLARVRESRANRVAQFAREREEIERDFRAAEAGLDCERDEAVDFLEAQRRDDRSALEPRRKAVVALRDALNLEFRQVGDLTTPPELAKARAGVAGLERTLANAKEQLSRLSGQVSLIKAKGEQEQQAINHQAKEERDTLQRQIDSLTTRKEQLELELEKFDDSLACFYQKHAPEQWPQAAKTLSRDTLFHNAEELQAEKTGKGSAAASEGVWGVRFSPDALPAPSGGFDRAALVALVEAVRVELADAKDGLQAAHERYLARCAELEKQIAEKLAEPQREIAKETEARRHSSNEIVRLENQVATLESQWEEAKRERKVNLDARDAKLRSEEEEIRTEEAQAEERFNVKKAVVLEEIAAKKAKLQEQTAGQRVVLEEEEAKARKEWEKQDAEIEESFQSALATKGVDPELIETIRAQSIAIDRKVAEIESFRDEVVGYQVKKSEFIDPLPTWRSELNMRLEAQKAKREEQKRAQERHRKVIDEIAQQLDRLNKEANELRKDKDAEERFRSDTRFLQEHGYFEREDLPAAPFYRPGAVAGYLREAEAAHQLREDMGRRGDKDARSFLNRFDAETLDRKVLGFSPIHLHFDWFSFVNIELRPFVAGHSIEKMKQIQTQEFEQLIRNICGKNAAFREGIRQVNQTASLVQKNLETNNFVDVLDSVELKVERVDNRLTQVLSELEEFADLTFVGDRDLFGKRADRDQAEKAIAAFEQLLREIDAHKGSVLHLTDCFDFLIRVHENGHDMGWRKSLDHIGSTGTDYLVKMLIYLSLIEVYRERTIDSREGQAAVHCVMDETGVLAAKYIRSVLDYAKERQIILITAGHSQQTVGFENWLLVRKRGKRFGGQAVLRRVLRCD